MSGPLRRSENGLLTLQRRTPTVSSLDSPAVQHIIDRDGASIVLVPVHGLKEPAKVRADDFERLTRAGYPPRFMHVKNGKGQSYVRVCHPTLMHGQETVARLVADVAKWQQVRYRDGNRMNLRRENLYVTRKPRRGCRFVEAMNAKANNGVDQQL